MKNIKIKCVGFLEVLQSVSCQTILSILPRQSSLSISACARKNASNIDFSLSKIQEPYPTINNNNRERNYPLPLLLITPWLSACATHNCVRYQDHFLTEAKFAANKYPLCQKNALNIDFPPRQIQEHYPTINSNKEKNSLI